MSGGFYKICPICACKFTRKTVNTYAQWDRTVYCSRKCVGRHKTLRANATRMDRGAHFWSKVQKSDGCWLWMAAIDKDGYGIHIWQKKTFRAARVSLELDGRPPAVGEFACHKCDNPRCVRPDHLFVGSPQDNVDDCRAKNRGQQGSRVWSSKLTEKDIRKIRASKEPNSALGKKYGVAASNITHIRTRQTWKHVT